MCPFDRALQNMNVYPERTALQLSIDTEDPTRKRGLVLAGGGAKGAFQSRVVSRLREYIEFDVLMGVSVGALNAAIMSTDQHEKLEQIWRRIGNSDIYTGGFDVWRGIQLLLGWKNSLYDTDPLHDLINTHYDPNKTVTPAVIGTVNLHSGEYVEYRTRPEEEYDDHQVARIRKSLLASSAIPVTFPPVELKTPSGIEKFADGGIRNITPLASMIEEDVDEIVVITTEPRHLSSTKEQIDTVLKVGERTLTILLNEIIREDISSVLRINRILDQCAGEEVVDTGNRQYRHIDITVIEPKFDLGSALDFSTTAYRDRTSEAEKISDRVIKKLGL